MRQSPAGLLFLWLLALALMDAGRCGTVLAAEVSKPAEPVAAWKWQPVYLAENRLVLQQPSPEAEIAFRVVQSDEWLPGFIPIFRITRGAAVELRRRPARGQENFSEPMFFAAPPLHDETSGRLAGAWEVEAKREEGSTAWLGWELATEGERVSGRFDQGTDYRFAYMTDGTFRSNRLEIAVQYIMDQYVLTGELRDGRWEGEWWRAGSSERQTWEGWRRGGPVALPEPGKLADLIEWRQVEDESARVYLLQGETPGSGWKRTAEPLCRVWRP